MRCLSGPAVERLSTAPITEVVVTNSIKISERQQFKSLTVLSVADLLAKAIRFTHYRGIRQLPLRLIDGMPTAHSFRHSSAATPAKASRAPCAAKAASPASSTAAPATHSRSRSMRASSTRLLEHISAENTVIDLTIDGTTSRTLIREIQRHPLKRNILHVDLQELVAGEKVEVRIPLVLQGIPAGVRTSGGILDQVMRELRVRVDPANIPSRIEVDVTELKIGHSVHVNEMTVPPRRRSSRRRRVDGGHGWCAEGDRRADAGRRSSRSRGAGAHPQGEG